MCLAEQYDYGERLKWGTSKKLTCCEDDSELYLLNADNSTANATAVAYQRMCPPPDGPNDLYSDAYANDQSLTFLRYGDNTQYLETINHEPYDYTQHFQMVTEPGSGRVYKRHCFHNRSLQSPIHFASITDYFERNAHLHNWNESDVNIEYDNTAGEEWNQEKHPESFYQLCVAERAKKTLCCEGTSRAPCQADSIRHLPAYNPDAIAGTWPASTECKYPGWNPNVAGEKGFCTDENDVTNGCDCDKCFGDNHNPDKWVPQVDVPNKYNEYFFFHGPC